MAIKIEKMMPEHWADVAQIYAEGIETGNATFQKEVPNWTTWDGDHLPYGRLIALNTEGSSILGWAALTAASGRCGAGSG